MTNEIFDVTIIGGGAAGLSAALWCDELGLDAVLLEANSELGGQLLWTYNAIENHLGLFARNGQEMRDVFVNQIENRKFLLKLNSRVKDVDLENKVVFLENGEKIESKFIVIATGIKRRELNVKGEKEFQGKGIIKSGKKEGKKVKDKAIAVIGGGDAAFENCLILSEFASKVYLVHRGKDFKARSEFIEPVKSHSKVEIITETVVKEIIGGDWVQQLQLHNKKTSETSLLSVDFILLRIGVMPNTYMFQEMIDLDEEGYVKINSQCETSVKHIYSIGDIANPISPTISSAVGMGSTAIKSILARF